MFAHLPSIPMKRILQLPLLPQEVLPVQAFLVHMEKQRRLKLGPDAPPMEQGSVLAFISLAYHLPYCLFQKAKLS